MPPRQEAAGRSRMSTMPPTAVIAACEARSREPSRPTRAKPEHVGQDRAGRRRFSSSRLTPWKPRIACSAGTSPPLQAGSPSAPGTATSARRHAVRVAGTGSTVSPKRFAGASCVHALLDEAMRPVAEGAFGHAERGLLGLADAEPARRGMLPREEGQDRAGPARLVAVIEVVGAGIVEVDGLLDEPKAERAGVEVEVAARRDPRSP